MHCDRPDISEKLVPFVEGALGEPDRTEVGGHLRRCEACQDEARLLKESILTLKAAARTGIWKEPAEHVSAEHLSRFFEDERAREAGFLPTSGLTEAQAKDVRIHLAECPECREELVLLRELEAEPPGEVAAGTQVLPRILRLEIERLYPTAAPVSRGPKERTVSLADRLMAWINPKSLVMASLCVVALTFSYALMQNGADQAPTPAATSEIAMVDKREEAPRAETSRPDPYAEMSKKLEKKGTALQADPKPAAATRAKKDAGPAADGPKQQPAAKSEEVASEVRTASAPSAPRQAPAAPAPRPAPRQTPAPRPAPRTVVGAAPPTPARVETPAPRPVTVTQAPVGAPAESEGDARGDRTPPVSEPGVVASAPTGPVANAMGTNEPAAASEPSRDEAPAVAAASQPGRVQAPVAMTESAKAGLRSTTPQQRTVKPPAPASVPVRSLPGESQSYQGAASEATLQTARRSMDGVADQVAMTRQADLGPRARAVARQISADASVLVEEHQDGSVTVTVRLSEPLSSEQKDKLRRMLRSQLDLGDNDIISIRQ